MKTKLIILAVTGLITGVTLAEFEEATTEPLEYQEVDRTAEARNIAEGECVQEMLKFLNNSITFTNPGTFTTEELEKDITKNGEAVIINGNLTKRAMAMFQKCVEETIANTKKTKYFEKQPK